MPVDPKSADRQAAEIIQTWLDGAPPDAAAVIAAHPEFATNKAVVLDLAFAEFLVRQMRGEQVDPEEFCARFPAYHASLGRMLAQQSVRETTDDEAARADGLGERTVEIPITPVASDPEVLEPTAGTGTSSPPTAGTRPAGPRARPAGPGRSGTSTCSGKWARGVRPGIPRLEEPTTKHVVVKLTRQSATRPRCSEGRARNVVSVLSAPHDVAAGCT